MLKLNLKNSVLLTGFTLLLAACGKDDDNGNTEPTGNASYLFAMRAQGAEESADYVWKVNSLDELMNGEINVEGKGIEQAGWSYYFGASNTLFSINYGDEGTTAYTADTKGDVIKKGSFYVERLDCTGLADDGNVVGVGAPWGGGSLDCEFMVINTKDILLSSRKFQPFYKVKGTDTLNCWPSGTVVIGDKVYVSYYPLDGETWDTPIMDTAYMDIYTYPGLDYVKTIKDTRTAPIGTYGSIPALMKTETGDIYTISPASYAAGYTQLGNPSGILRIKAGTEAFDDSYFWNFETSAVAGKLMSCFYLGENKALVRYIPKERDTEDQLWNGLFYEQPLCKMAIIDLVAKSITPVTGLPDHGGEYGGSVFIEDGNIYKGIYSTVTNECRIYRINIATAEATKGALIKGLEMPIIYKVTY